MRRRAVVFVLASVSWLSACGGSGPTVNMAPVAADAETDSDPPTIPGTDADATGAEDAPQEPDAPEAPSDVPDTSIAPTDTIAPGDPGGDPGPADADEPSADVVAPVPDEGLDTGPEDTGPEDTGPEDAGPLDVPPDCACGPDQVCVAGECVPKCQGGCECAPGPNDCPVSPGGGLVPGATTPDAFAALKELSATSIHWGECQAGDELACHLFLREATRHLHEEDPNWGLLSKVPGQNQCSATACGNEVSCGYAGDAIIYRSTDQVVDVIAGAGAPGTSVAWQLVPKLDINDWVPPPCVAPAIPPDRLLSGESLAAGQSRVSDDGRFELAYQADGDLVLTHLGVGVLWSSGTKSAPGSVGMQPDGNLVIYDAVGTPLWASGTGGNPGAWLVVQTDGNVLINSEAGTALWATGTCCY